jgi:hypothetical protein
VPPAVGAEGSLAIAFRPPRSPSRVIERCCVLFGDALRFVRSRTFVISRSRPPRTPLLGFIDSPSPATAAASTPGRPAPCDACLPSDRTCQVRSRSVLAVPPGFNGFLRSDARPRLLPCGRLGGSQVCCTLQPAVGFATFPARRSLAASRPRGRHGPKIVVTLFPVASTLRSVPLPGSLPVVTAAFRRRLRSPTARAFSSLVSGRRSIPHPGLRRGVVSNAGSFDVDLKALLHRRVRCVLVTLPSVTLDAPMGF